MKYMVETDNGKMMELKPCPFCGGEPVIDSRQSGYFIHCKGCHIAFNEGWMAVGPDKLAEMWNRRASE